MFTTETFVKFLTFVAYIVIRNFVQFYFCHFISPLQKRNQVFLRSGVNKICVGGLYPKGIFVLLILICVLICFTYSQHSNKAEDLLPHIPLSSANTSAGGTVSWLARNEHLFCYLSHRTTSKITVFVIET